MDHQLTMRKQVKIVGVHSADENLRHLTEILIEASKQNNKRDMVGILLEELQPIIEIKVRKAFELYAKTRQLDVNHWEWFRPILRRFL